MREAGTAEETHRSAFEKRRQLLVQLLERHRASELFTIDEEGRRRIDLQLFERKVVVGLDLFEKGCVLLASFDGFSAHAEMVANRLQGVERTLRQLLLPFEDSRGGIEELR